MIQACPEVKNDRFQAFCTNKSVSRSNVKNMTYNIFQWEERLKKDGFDRSSEVCSVYHHSVAAVAINWSTRAN
jgi:hypothetical protein